MMTEDTVELICLKELQQASDFLKRETEELEYRDLTESTFSMFNNVQEMFPQSKPISVVRLVLSSMVHEGGFEPNDIEIQVSAAGGHEWVNLISEERLKVSKSEAGLKMEKKAIRRAGRLAKRKTKKAKKARRKNR